MAPFRAWRVARVARLILGPLVKRTMEKKAPHLRHLQAGKPRLEIRKPNALRMGQVVRMLEAKQKSLDGVVGYGGVEMKMTN